MNKEWIGETIIKHQKKLIQLDYIDY